MPPFLQRTIDFFKAAIAYFKQNPTLYFLLFLNFFGLLLFVCGIRTRSVGPALFLAELTLILLTVSYFFIRGAALHEFEQHIRDVSAHPGGVEQMAQEMAQLSHAVIQLNEIVSQIGQIKEFMADFDSYKKGLSAIRQDVTGAMSLKDDVARLSEEMAGLKAAAEKMGALDEAVAQIEGVKQSLQDAAAGREALSKAIIALKADVQKMGSESERIDGLSEEIAKLQQGSPGEGGAAPDLEELRQKLSEIEGKVAGIAQSGPVGVGEMGEKMEEWAKAGKALEGKLSGIREEFAKVEKRLKALDGVAKAAAGEGPDPQIGEAIGGLKEEIAEAAKGASEEIKELGDELRREITTVKSQLEGVSEVGDVTEAISSLREEVTALRAKVKGGGGKGGAVDEDLRKEVDELKEVIADFAANQPKLDVEVKEAKLVPQQDRTMVQCSLIVKNLSNRPNEVVAVRAELDSGRDRMTPTSVRQWLPEGTEANSDRRVFLPMNVLEKSASDPIDLIVAGWPLERTQETYAFRITLKDKAGNEFVKAIDLKPEKKKA